MMKRRSITVAPRPTYITVTMVARAVQDYGGLEASATSALAALASSGSSRFCFKKGDLINVSKMDSEGHGFGTLDDGRTGWFPMELVEEERQPKKRVTTFYLPKSVSAGDVEDGNSHAAAKDDGDNDDSSWDEDDEANDSDDDNDDSDGEGDEDGHDDASSSNDAEGASSVVVGGGGQRRDSFSEDGVAGKANVSSIRGKISSFLSIRPSREDLQKKHILYDEMNQGALSASNKEAKMKLEGFFNRRTSTIETGVVKGKHLAEFGVPLMELSARYNAIRGVPFVVFLTVNYLIENGMDSEGLFRISVELNEIMVLKVSLEQGLTSLDPGTNPHAVAALMKQFFRELPDPLLTFGMFDQWMDAAGIDDNEKRVAAIASLVATLGKAQRTTLAYLIVFLRLLALYSDKNKMSCLNLGVIFAPTILRKKVESVDDFMKFARAQYLVETLLDEYERFFPEYKEAMAALPPLPEGGEESLASKLQRVLLATEEEKDKIRKLPMDRLAFFSKDDKRPSTPNSSTSPGKKNSATGTSASPSPPGTPTGSPGGTPKKKGSVAGLNSKRENMRSSLGGSSSSSGGEEKKKKKKKNTQSAAAAASAAGEEREKKRKDRVPGKIRKTPSEADFQQKKKKDKRKEHSPPPKGVSTPEVRPTIPLARRAGSAIVESKSPKAAPVQSPLLKSLLAERDKDAASSDSEKEELSVVEAERKKLEEEKKNLEQEKKVFEGEKEMLAVELKKQLDVMEEEKGKLNEALTNLEEERKALKQQKENFDLEVQHNKKQQQQQQQQQQVSPAAASATGSDWEKKAKESTEQNNKLKKEAEDLRKQVRTLFKEKEELEKGQKLHAKEKEKWAFDLKNLAQQKEELEAGHVILQKVKERADKLLQTQKEETEKLKQSLQKEKDQLLARNKALTQKTEDMQKELAAVKSSTGGENSEEEKGERKKLAEERKQVTEERRMLEEEKGILQNTLQQLLGAQEAEKKEMERLLAEVTQSKELFAQKQELLTKAEEREKVALAQLEEEKRKREASEKELKESIEKEVKERLEKERKQNEEEEEKRHKVEQELARQKQENEKLVKQLEEQKLKNNNNSEEKEVADESHDDDEEDDDTGSAAAARRARRRRRKRKGKAGTPEGGGQQLLNILDNNNSNNKQQQPQSRAKAIAANGGLVKHVSSPNMKQMRIDVLEREREKDEQAKKQRQKELDAALDKQNRELERMGREQLKALGAAVEKLVQHQAEEMKRVHKQHSEQLKHFFHG